MARRSRAAAAAIRTPTPQVTEASDQDSVEHHTRGPASPQIEGSEVEAGDHGSENDGYGEEDRDTPVNDSDPNSPPLTPARSQNLVAQRRRAGRPPRTRARVSNVTDETESRDLGSDVGTPKRRGGWRGRGFGGGRWGKPRGGPSHVTQVPLDKEGNMASVKDDEIELPEDPEGETKVDKNGVLLGKREYKVRVFTISGKGDRLYMLSTEPARCIGFRDSYLFFQKHRTLWKIILSEEAKRDLIERTLIPHSYKGRAIGVVTARSVFREFGARIIIGGRKVVDDYQAGAARARGDIEGELAVPDDKLPVEGDPYDKNRFVAWHGASSVYHSGVPSIPLLSGKNAEGKKRRVVMTGTNWMFEHAREASRFNSSMTLNRRKNLDGVYDPHTNVMHQPRIMQPTHARWEEHIYEPASTLDSYAEPGSENSLFCNVEPILQRNFLISDTIYTGPPISGLGIPGPDGSTLDIGSSRIAHSSNDVLTEISNECQQALEYARKEESIWKHTWTGEGLDGFRAQLPISYNM